MCVCSSIIIAFIGSIGSIISIISSVIISFISSIISIISIYIAYLQSSGACLRQWPGYALTHRRMYLLYLLYLLYVLYCCCVGMLLRAAQGGCRRGRPG
jgi:hypothetical protein